MTAKRKNSDFPDKETIKKYLEGKLPPDEAYRIEKLILSDPFYQEAMDGIESIHTDKAEKDISELSGKVRKRSHSQKGTITRFYRIAAAIIVLAISSYILFITAERFDRVSKKDSITQKQDGPEKMPQGSVNPEESKPDQLEDSDTEIPEIKIQASEVQKSITALNEEPEEGGDNVENKEHVIPEINAEKDEVSTKPDPFFETIEEEVETVPQIEIMDEEAEADITMPLDVPEEQMDYAQEVPIQEEEILGESIQEPAPMISNDVETSKRKKQTEQRGESKAAGDASNHANSMDIDEILKPEPVLGFDDFEKYIKENQRYPVDSLGKNIEGFVVLQFVIKSDSLPSKIKVIQSLSKSCDQEAIRLLKEGPKWKPVFSGDRLIEDRVNYTISFELKD